MLNYKPWFHKDADQFRTLCLTKPEVEALKKILTKTIAAAEADAANATTKQTAEYNKAYAEFLVHMAKKMGYQASTQPTPEELLEAAS